MKCVAAVVFFGVLTHEAWSKPNQLSISDLGTNVGGRLGSALGQTVGAGLDSVQELGAGVLGLGAGLVGGVGSGLGSGLQAGLSPGRGSEGPVNVDLNAGANGQGKLYVDANVYNDRSSYPNGFPITTNNAGSGIAAGVGLGYRATPEYGYGGNYVTGGGFNGGGGPRIQYPATNNPHSAGYGGSYLAGGGLGYQNVAPHVYHSLYTANSPYNMNDPRIGVSYGPVYRPAVEYVNGGPLGSGWHYPAVGQGYPHIGAHAYPDVYPPYYPANTHNVRLDSGYVNGGGFYTGARSHRLHNAEANRNRASYPSGYTVASNNPGTNNDARPEYGGARSGNGLGIRADGFPAVDVTISEANVAAGSRRRPDPSYDDTNETSFDVRIGIDSSGTRIAEPNVAIGVQPNVDRKLESGSAVGVDTNDGNGVSTSVENRSESYARFGVEDGVGNEVRPSVATEIESESVATVDNEAEIGIRV